MIDCTELVSNKRISLVGSDPLCQTTCVPFLSNQCLDSTNTIQRYDEWSVQVKCAGGEDKSVEGGDCVCKSFVAGPTCTEGYLSYMSWAGEVS